MYGLVYALDVNVVAVVAAAAGVVVVVEQQWTHLHLHRRSKHTSRHASDSSF
jgi:hypothetical protein